MKLHETRKAKGIEVANHEYAKGPREWPTGGAGRPGPVATLGDPFSTSSASVYSTPVRVFW